MKVVKQDVILPVHSYDKIIGSGLDKNNKKHSKPLPHAIRCIISDEFSV